MPRSPQDAYKRKCAQAVNHLGAAVLDVNDVYKPFAEAKRQEAEELKAIMLEIAISREKLLAFVKRSWYLEEEQLIGWL